MLDRNLQIDREVEILAPYAMASKYSRGRRFKERPSSLRTDFQRDRGRIIHSAAFRRLEYKTQVFVNHEGDHYRTRLTHTIEAAQIGRAIARALRLNEDFTEAVVLAHDLGHTPFGHAGERVMNGLMKGYGGFEHNLQSLRVVDKLESRYPGFEGLNLTYEVREGLAKHSTPYDKSPALEEFDPSLSPPLEAQIADLADEIAYNNHDVDDGLSSGLLTWEGLLSIELFAEAEQAVRKDFGEISYRELKHMVVSRMIATLVEDLVRNTEANIKKHGIKNVEDVRATQERVVCFSSSTESKKNDLKDYLMSNMYLHWRVIRMEEKARRILTDLFEAFMQRQGQIPKEFRDRSQGDSDARVICDYLAGMTDRFAIEEHRRLFDPHMRV